MRPLLVFTCIADGRHGAIITGTGYGITRPDGAHQFPMEALRF